MSETESKSGEKRGVLRFGAYAEPVPGGLRITVTADPEPGVDLGAVIDNLLRCGRLGLVPGAGVLAIVPPVGPGTKVRRRPDGRYEPVAEGEPYHAELVAPVLAEMMRDPVDAVAEHLGSEDVQAYEMAGAGLASAPELREAVDRLREKLSPAARTAFDEGRQRYLDSHAAIDAVEELERDILDRRGLKHELRQVDPEVRKEIRRAWLAIVVRACRRSRREVPWLERDPDHDARFAKSDPRPRVVGPEEPF